MQRRKDNSIRVKRKLKIISGSLIQRLILILMFSVIICGFVKADDSDIQVITDSVSCFGGNDGCIFLVISDTTQQYTAAYFKNSPKSNSLIPVQENNSTFFKIPNLEAGKYFVEIKGNKGSTWTKSIEVTQPDRLESGKITVEKKLSSSDSSDAILRASATGGTLPYSYKWNREGSANCALMKNVPQGTYSCIITDANNCSSVKTDILFNSKVLPDIIEE